jgi:pyruvate/2-oxoglutarate dehydrogenase complex dihydrolipoamide acyltransferase (E2) component
MAAADPSRFKLKPPAQHPAPGERPVVDPSSTFDHRIVDGRQADRFTQRIKDFQEESATLFIG